MQRTLIINRQFVKTNTCFPLFSYTFFSIFPHPHIQFSLAFEEKWVWASSFHIHFSNPQIQISARFGENGLGPHPVEYPFVTACVLRAIDPLNEGLVIPPLGVEKLSPRFNFFDNVFFCIT